MRVLIIRLGAFGDILHTLPLAADLAAAGCEVDWVCDEPWQVVLENNPAISRVFPVPRKKWKRRGAWFNGAIVNGLRHLAKSLRARHYDVAIDAQGRSKSALVALISGARARVCHRSPIASEAAWLLSQRRFPGEAEHIVDKIRSLGLSVLKHKPDAQWHFPLPVWVDEHTWAQAFFDKESLQRPWIWNVGGTWPTKLWPLESQKALLKLLCDEGKQVVVTWGPGWEQEHAEELLKAEPRAVMAPASSLSQLAALIHGAEIMISCDTGPLHLALALDVPAVGLFGPVPAERNGPRGRGYRNIQAPGELWERRDISKVNMSAITPQQVYQEALKCLAERQ